MTLFEQLLNSLSAVLVVLNVFPYSAEILQAIIYFDIDLTNKGIISFKVL